MARTSAPCTAAGTYTAPLRLRDDHGSTPAPDAVQIDVGDMPPTPTITTLAAGQRFAVGETIPLRGTARCM